MNNIKKYQEYVDYNLNESIISDIKDKIKNFWNNYKYKELFLRKMIFYLDAGHYIFFFLVVVNLFSLFFGYNNSIIILLYWVNFFIRLALNTPLNNNMKITIRKKLEDLLKNGFDTSEIYILNGNKKDIKKAINRLKEDNVLNDSNFLTLNDGVTILDLSGEFKKKNKININRDLDPFGEENWDDEKKLYKDWRKPAVIKNLIFGDVELLYNVKFINFNNINSQDFREPIFKLLKNLFKKRKNELIYKGDLDFLNKLN